MKLRNYTKEDSGVICSWITDEKSLYQWSADRIGKFPLCEDDLNKIYESEILGGRFIPLCAVDENNNIEGHFFIRYPNKEDSGTIRIGFVIINPALRGSGKGKEMLELMIDYAKNVLSATKITLGVFTNNDSAKYCYRSIGFQNTGIINKYKMKIGEWDCIEMEMHLN